MKMRCMLLLFSKVFWFYFLLLGLTINNSFQLRGAPGRTRSLQHWLLYHYRRKSDEPLPQGEHNLRSSQDPTTSRQSRPRAQECSNWSCCSLGRVSHPQFYFTGIGSLAELSEHGYVLKGNTLHRDFACSLLDCKAKAVHYKKSEYCLSSLLPPSHFQIKHNQILMIKAHISRLH